MSIDELEYLRSLVKEMRTCLIDILKDRPVADCNDFHHYKTDQGHPYGECPPSIRWLNSIEKAQNLIWKNKK